jgi:hypothetical protein
VQRAQRGASVTARLFLKTYEQLLNAINGVGMKDLGEKKPGYTGEVCSTGKQAVL